MQLQQRPRAFSYGTISAFEPSNYIETIMRPPDFRGKTMKSSIRAVAVLSDGLLRFAKRAKKDTCANLIAAGLLVSSCASEEPIIKYLKTGESSIEKVTIDGKTHYSNYFPACHGSRFLLQSPPYDTREDCAFAENDMQAVKIIKKYLASHTCRDLDELFAMHDNGDRTITPEEFAECGLDTSLRQ
jgi:hypothetical protein